MNRINLFRNTRFQEAAIRKTPAKNALLAWGKTNFEKTGGVVVFAALLIVCSIAVGCSGNSSKPTTSNNVSPAAPSAPTQMLANSSVPAPVTPEAKPAPKKVTRKRPATVTYVDKTYGVSFEYPRRYAIETGDAASDLLSSSALPMNFALPGGSVLAAVELPETGFANTDFSSAFFDVSVNNRISEEDCGRFAVPETPVSAAVTPLVQALLEPAAPVQNASTESTQAASDAPRADVKASETASSSEAKTPEAKTAAPAENSNPASTIPAVAPAPKVMLSDMEMRKTEAVSGEGNQQSDTKYFHVYQNGACYEFALNVTTVASQADGEMKHVDRDKVFNRLHGILVTVKINPIEAEKEAASAPVPAK